MKVLSPTEITQAAQKAGEAKAQRTQNTPGKLLMLSIMGGAFIALGGLLSIIAGYGFPEITAQNPALQKILSALTFPVGLTLIVILGAELFTGNNALLIPPLLKKKTSAATVLKNWTIVWLGNFMGALIFTYCFTYLTGTLAQEPYHNTICQIAITKTSLPWITAFLRGIAANWCVCLAIWMALSAHTLPAKALACWIPVATFVALGYEHSIANMFFIPCGMMYGADITIPQLLMCNLLPVTLGNILGGALLVGTTHTRLNPA